MQCDRRLHDDTECTDYSLDGCVMSPECYSPYYLDYDWSRWAEPAYDVPSLDMNWYCSADGLLERNNEFTMLMITKGGQASVISTLPPCCLFAPFAHIPFLCRF